jgi:hypothetical protein
MLEGSTGGCQSQLLFLESGEMDKLDYKRT